MTFLLLYWRYVVMALLLAALGIQTMRLHHEQKAFNDFRVSVEALGRAQKAENERILKERETTAKEVEDAKNKAISDLSTRYAAARRLLNDARSGGVPSTPAAPTLASACEPSGGPDRRLDELEAALLDALERADQELIKYRQLWQWAQSVR